MMFSIGLLAWWISPFFMSEEDEGFTWADGMHIAGQIAMVTSVINFAWGKLL